MSSSAPDYKKLYRLQDKVFELLSSHLDGYYLTGGTALGRFYLHHRYSDDLDFFMNNNSSFESRTEGIFRVLKKHYPIDETVTVKSESFVRIMMAGDPPMKIELVNDIAYRWGEALINEKQIPVDNVANILANKLGALLSRDEPKDVFDILSIASAYSFNWKEVYRHAFEKHIMNEQDVAMRLNTFPAELFTSQPWLKEPVDPTNLKAKLDTIVDDFLFARNNSLGEGKVAITEAGIDEAS